MKLSLGIGAMLVTAVLAGATGGAVALSAAQGGPAPSAPSVTLHQVAEDAASSPAPTAVAADEVAVESNSEPVESNSEGSAPSAPAPIVESVPKPETASEAADRAKAEADRAKAEADRAAEVAAAPKPAPSPVPAKTVEPAPQPFCAAKGPMPRGAIGEVRLERVEPKAGNPMELPKDGYEVTWKCFASDGPDGGVWESTKVKVLPAPTPVQDGGADGPDGGADG